MPFWMLILCAVRIVCILACKQLDQNGCILARKADTVGIEARKACRSVRSEWDATQHDSFCLTNREQPEELYGKQLNVRPERACPTGRVTGNGRELPLQKIS
jgi:hypothetical protein